MQTTSVAMRSDTGSPSDRGRDARQPTQIPRSGWKDIALRARRAAAQGNLSVVAAGVTFFVLLSIAPALAALAAVFGVFVDSAAIGRHVGALAYVLPDAVQRLLEQQLAHLSLTSRRALGIGSLGGILAVWSGVKATRAMIAAIDLAYCEPETRGFVRLNLTAAGLALGLLAVATVELAIAMAVPVVLPALGLGAIAEPAIRLMRWPALVGFLMLVLAVLYRYAPDRARARWSWTSPGALLGATLWTLGSVALSLLVLHSNRYEALYGSLGAAVVLMMWVYVGVYSVLLGAVINAEAERQTTRDTTEGNPQPLGQRNAYAADTVGPAAGAGEQAPRP